MVFCDGGFCGGGKFDGCGNDSYDELVVVVMFIKVMVTVAMITKKMMSLVDILIDDHVYKIRTMEHC